MTKNRNLAYIALILNAAIWGAALPIIKPALSHVTPFHYLFLRYLIAIPFSIPILAYLIIKFKPKLKTLLTIIALEAIAITTALSFLYEGLSRTTSIEASFIANAAPVFIIIGGILFLREKEQTHEFIGLIFAIAGITILTLEPLTRGISGLQSLSLSGNIFVVGHNFFWASYVLLAKKYYAKINKLLIGFTSLWVGLISFYLLTITKSPNLIDPALILQPLTTPSVLIAALYMGILGSIVAVPAYIIGNNLIEASEASLFTYLQPLFYVPLATLWLKEPFTLIMATALLVTTVGVLIASQRTRRHQKLFSFNPFKR